MPSHPRVIPSIEQLRQRAAVRRIEARYGRDATVQALRAEAAALRERLAASTVEVRDAAEAAERIEAGLEARLGAALSPSLQPVINASGVIVHTNLGRAPLGPAAIARIAAVASGYANLEYDLPGGRRGSRTAHASRLLTRLTGAESAVVVNNPDCRRRPGRSWGAGPPNVRPWTRLTAWDTRLAALMHAVERENQLPGPLRGPLRPRLRPARPRRPRR